MWRPLQLGDGFAKYLCQAQVFCESRYSTRGRNISAMLNQAPTQIQGDIDGNGVSNKSG